MTKRLAREAPDVRQRLEQRLRLGDQRLHGHARSIPVSDRSSQDEPGQVLVAGSASASRPCTYGGVDDDLVPAALGRGERELLEQRLHDRVQPPRADVLGALVDLGGDLGDRLDRVAVNVERRRPRSPAAPTYCRVSAFFGSVRMRTKSSRVRASSSTRIGKRPCSSGIRSDGLATWNAPAAMNSMWSVCTGPYLVVTVEPSTIGSRSRCTPSRETSGPCLALAAGDLVDLVEEHDAGVARARDRLALDRLVDVDQLLRLLLRSEHARASATVSLRRRACRPCRA